MSWNSYLKKCSLVIGVVAAFPHIVMAQNPIVQTKHTADPAPMVYNNKVYLYTGHDEDNSTWFTMNDWLLYTSTDMVNWTEHPSPLSYRTFSWAASDAWAAQCIERNGKFYMYVPVTSKENNRCSCSR